MCCIVLCSGHCLARYIPDSRQHWSEDCMLSSQTHPPVRTWAKRPLRTTPIRIGDRYVNPLRRAVTYPLVVVEDSTLFRLVHSKEAVILYWLEKIQSGVSFSLAFFLLFLRFFHLFLLLSYFFSFVFSFFFSLFFSFF